jgi:hypothetical protein
MMTRLDNKDCSKGSAARSPASRASKLRDLAKINKNDRSWQYPLFHRYLAVGALILLLLQVGRTFAATQNEAKLAVTTEVTPGLHYVGQGFELRLGVVASGKAPRIEPPRVPGARIWQIGIKREPITATGIGAKAFRESRFFIALRVVAERSGVLEIPSIAVKVDDRSARSRAIRVRIQPVPLDGRTAEFLGGVGRFVVEAEAVPQVVRVGQELDFRIKVTGPAAWGMKERPDLARFQRLPLGLRINSKDDETVNEPPARTFVYRLRPTKPGEAALPPVSIAAYDPALSRFITQTTRRVPIRVIAVPSFDPAAIDDGRSSGISMRREWLVWTSWGSSAILLLASYAALARVRRRLRRRPEVGPQAARRFAAELARRLGRGDWRPHTSGLSSILGPPSPDHETARRVCDEMIRYLEIGIVRPPGALTPDEAREGVIRLTGREELGRAAGELTTRCDQLLYGEFDAGPFDRKVLEQARGLFTALGRVRIG